MFEGMVIYTPLTSIKHPIESIITFIDLCINLVIKAIVIIILSQLDWMCNTNEDMTKLLYTQGTRLT